LACAGLGISSGRVTGGKLLVDACRMYVGVGVGMDGIPKLKARFGDCIVPGGGGIEGAIAEIRFW
jgi:hypothetical protein